MTGKQHTVSRGVPFNLFERLSRPFRYRELLLNLVRKELKVRYKDSVLGFMWSMLNPVLYLVVFYVVFDLFLGQAVPEFHFFLLSGLLPWTLFATSVQSGAGSVVANGALLKKVYFPREVLPMSAVGGALFHFGLQMMVLMAFLLIFRHDFISEYLVLVPAALAVELLLVAGIALLLSGLTVYLRDIQHFLELALLAWIWMTPIIYPVADVFTKLNPRGMFGLYLLNPMTPIVLSFQRAFYNQVAPIDKTGNARQVLLDEPVWWYLEKLGYVALLGIAFLVVGQIVFAKAEGNFAEEL
ncbi:MAG TPA: ABC transporter permease [Actinomycetota bacterium]|nr:ABC transporter permease [Actinomycetota bacterium]